MDNIRTRASTREYRSNWDNVFSSDNKEENISSAPENSVESKVINPFAERKLADEIYHQAAKVNSSKFTALYNESNDTLLTLEANLVELLGGLRELINMRNQ